LSPEALTTQITRGGEVSGRRFDPRSAAPFVYKSTSEETRRAYRRTLLEFFRFVGMRHPADVVPDEVLRWRDTLRSQRKSAATVSFKLSVVRAPAGGGGGPPDPRRDEAGAAARGVEPARRPRPDS
jgi:hypothetical protein